MLDEALAGLQRSGWRAELQRDVDLSMALCFTALAEDRVEVSTDWRAQGREALRRASLTQALGDDHRAWLKQLA